jgi:hypothetical protein
LAFAQAPQQGQAPPVSFSGRVVTGSGSDARPVRRARVTLAGSGLSEPRVSSTDTNGHYSFEKLPPGDYKVTFQKAGYVKFETPAVAQANVSLLRGAAIEGTVFDASGNPVGTGNRVMALQAAPPGGATQTAVGQATTNDLGQYRIHSLPAGDYFVSATMAAGREYYPAASRVEDARPLRVDSGGEARGIDVTLPPGPLPPDTPPTAPPQSPAEVSMGSGRIAGRVMGGDTGKPLKGARVQMVLPGGIRLTKYANTDAQGRFEFAGLAAGRYQLTVVASRYVTVSYGQRRPADATRPIDLKEQEAFTSAEIVMPRTGAIEGTLLDEFGDPVPGVMVQGAQSAFVAGRSRLMPAGAVPQPSDDKGRFRIPNLSPARYYLVGLSGPFGSDNSAPGFSPTYYPGTADPASAQPIAVEHGADTTNVVLAMQPSRTAHVAGRVVDAAGQPAGRRGLVLFQIMDGDTSFVGGRGGSEPDGSFRFADVPVGSYVLQVLTAPPAREFGSTLLQVADADVSGVVLKVSKGATARGRIIFDGDAPPPRVQDIRISARPIEFVTSPSVGFGPPSPRVSPDWTFEMSDLHGLGVLGVDGLPGWMLKRVMLNGQDVINTPLDFRNGDVGNLEVTLSSRVSAVAGDVSDDKSAPVSDYAVVIFAVDRARWTFPSRYVALARPSQNGGFKVTLPAEEYLAVALPLIEGMEWQNPALLERLRPVATSFSLQEGESKTLALKLKKRP